MENTAKKYSIKTFGIAREIMGGREVTVAFDGQTVADLKEHLMTTYPELRSLKSFFISVNHAYADDTTGLQERDEIGIIPPVSGG